MLLADEPTGNLDSEATAEVLDLLAACHDAGQTIVLVTHDPRVGRAADRLLRMEDGEIVSEQGAASAGRREWHGRVAPRRR